MTSRDDRQGPEPGKRKPHDRSQPVKPAVPLENLIEANSRGSDTEAADRLASEAAKAPPPEVEAPDRTYPELDESVLDLVKNKRRQKS